MLSEKKNSVSEQKSVCPEIKTKCVSEKKKNKVCVRKKKQSVCPKKKKQSVCPEIKKQSVCPRKKVCVRETECVSEKKKQSVCPKKKTKLHPSECCWLFVFLVPHSLVCANCSLNEVSCVSFCRIFPQGGNCLLRGIPAS